MSSWSRFNSFDNNDWQKARGIAIKLKEIFGEDFISKFKITEWTLKNLS
jgi:hypothetical protein